MIELRTPPVSAGRSHSDFTDEHLMEMIQAHSPSGLELLQDRYAKLMKVVSMNMLHNHADADDLIQEVFSEVWNRAASYNPLKGRPLAWIVTLTRRRSIDRLRKRDTYGRVKERFTEEFETKDDCWTHVHEDLAQGERHEYVQRAMATLPEAQRKAINLAYHKQMTQREIATHTGIPIGTIKTRLELGLRKMAVSLYGFEDLLWVGLSAARAQKKVSKTTAKVPASTIPSR